MRHALLFLLFFNLLSFVPFGPCEASELSINVNRLPFETEKEVFSPNVSVVSRETIEKEYDYSPNDILLKLPSSTVLDTIGQYSLLSGVSFRSFVAGGQNASREIYLLDGTRFMGYERSNAFNPQLQLIPPKALERIEVARGGSSTIYGLNSGAGVVSFVTRRPNWKERTTELEFRGGENSTSITDFYFSTPIEEDRLTFSTALRHLQTDGFRENTRSQNKGARLLSSLSKLGYNLEEGRYLELQFAFLDSFSAWPSSLNFVSEYPNNFFQVSSRDEEDFSRQKMRRVGLRYESPFWNNSQLSVALSYTADDYENLNETTFNLPKILYDDDLYSAVIEISRGMVLGDWRHRFNFGFDGFVDNESNITDVMSGFGTDSIRDVQAKQGGVFIQDRIELPWEGHRLTLGYRWDKLDLDATVTEPSNQDLLRLSKDANNLKALYEWQVSDKFQVFAGVSRSFNLPKSSSYLPNPSFGTLKNLNLGIERDDEFNAGFHYQTTYKEWKWGFSATAFVIDQRDPVVFIGNQNVNAGRIKREGLELEADVQYKNFRADLSYTDNDAVFTDIRGFSSGFVPGRVGAKVPQVPDQVFTATAVLVYPEKVTTSVSFRYNGKQYPGSDNDNSQNPDPSYSLLGARISYQWKENTSIFVEGDNLLDEDYFTYSIESGSNLFVVPGAPREFRAGFSISF